MKRIISSIAFTLLFFSLVIGCKPLPQSVYYGYFIDSLTRKPIAGVLLRPIGSSRTYLSDRNGYFEIPYGRGHALHIYKENYVNDTVIAYISLKEEWYYNNRNIDIFQGENVLLKRHEEK